MYAVGIKKMSTIERLQAMEACEIRFFIMKAKLNSGNSKFITLDEFKVSHKS
jgi:hypothetical protein